MLEKQKVARQADMLKKRMPEEERQIAKQVKGKKKAKARAEEADGFDVRFLSFNLNRNWLITT